MDSGSVAERAIALIASRKATRSDQLALALDTDTETIASALASACASGALVTCKVNRLGSTPVNEYRVSASGPVHDNGAAQPKTAPIPPERVLSAARAARAIQPEQEKAMTTVREKIIAVLKKRGPMTSRQMSAHVDCKWLSVACSQLTRRGVLGRLGGTKSNSIYGLPEQESPGETRVDKPPRSVHARGAKKARRGLGGGRRPATSAARPRTVREAHKTVRTTHIQQGAQRLLGDLNTDLPAAAAGGFRAAVASDGAMIFLGAAAGTFELTRNETRALVSFVRVLDGAQLAA